MNFPGEPGERTTYMFETGARDREVQHLDVAAQLMDRLTPSEQSRVLDYILDRYRYQASDGTR